MQVTKIIYGIITLIIVLMNNASANVERSISPEKQQNTINLEAMDEQIFIDPWLSYQKILELDPQSDINTPMQRLWWFIRKAQCENLLYFYEKFDITIQELAQQINPQTPLEIRVRLKFFQGQSLQRSGDYIGSRKYFKQAMALAKQGEYHHQYVKAKLEMAYTHSLADLFETSLADMQEAYIEAFALNDQFLIAMINETYGAIYGYMRENEKSLEYYQKALETYERLGYKPHIAEAIYGIASTYRYWKKYDQAVENFKLYQEKVSYTPNSNISYFGSYGLGMTLAEQGKCEQALEVIEQAFTKQGLVDYDAELYKRKASCLIKLGRLAQAEKALQQAKALFAQLPELTGTVWQTEVDKIEAELAYAHGKYQTSYQMLASYYQHYTETLLESSSARVSSIRASMELERQEVEKALLNQRKKAEQLAFKADEQQTFQQQMIIIFLLVLLLIVVAVTVYQYRTNKKITELSIIDPLSGLYNRRYIFNYLEKLIAGTSANKSELSVMVLDLDNFKAINDQYGHPMGDRVIEQIAKIALQTLRTEDVIGRIGGEEFLCVLPRTDIEQCRLIAERMKSNLEQYHFMTDKNERFCVSASFGIAKLTASEQDAKQLYANADKALYSAKAAGKNCVVVF